ncbi:MAG TPA: ABC transporter ATP-binding protein/permease [Steroidobacteraceae bacterium]|nr:ABC transporter ATP-binding protein/permease [Steroidobacteraceae bacterium]
MRRLLRLIVDAWSLSIPFWRGEERWIARGCLAAVISLNLALVGVAVLLTYWQRAFYNSLEAKDWQAFIALLFWWRHTSSDGFVPSFALLAGVTVPITAYAQYLRQALQIRWRRWATEGYLDAWLADRVYYRMALIDLRTDNSDQRLAEDVRLYVDGFLTLGVGALRAFVSFCSFVALLWSLSASVSLFHRTIPGSLVWIALLYSVVGTGLAHLFGHRLTSLNVIEQKVEADFRFALMRFRENCESIAFYRGEAEERRGFATRFSGIRDNWHAIMKVTKRLTLFTTGFGQLALVFPLGIVAPAYFAGQIPLGAIFQISNAFVQVQGALSWLVDNYAVLTSWLAAVERLQTFNESVRSARQSGTGPVISVSAQGMSVSNLRVSLPCGADLLRHVELELKGGEHVLLEGPSGSGKSTLFRALAGLWPFGDGHICSPAGRQLFIPQRSYLPLGTLKRAVCYPLYEHELPDAAVTAALHAAGLPYLASRLGDAAEWDACLSGGERERLVLARILLVKPDWIFLDEATAHLDPASEYAFYQTLFEYLPQAGWISIAHRPQLAPFHDRTIRVLGGRLETGQSAISGRTDTGPCN